MGACTGIFQGSSYDCENPLKAGVNERLLVGNLDDVEQFVFNDTKKTVIEDVIMKAGTMLYAFEGVRSSNVPDLSLVVDDIAPSFKHQIDFASFQVSSDDKLNLQAMAAKKMFAIYQNPKDSSLGDSIWEVLGAGAGLEMSALNRLPASKDGSYKIQLATSENSAETQLPNSFWDTDIETTEAILNGLYSGGNLALVSATVETAAPTDIILTFDKTITSFGNIALGGTPNTFVGGVIAGVVVTVSVGTPYVAAEVIDISGTFESADGVIDLTNEVVTNNVV